MRKEIVYEWRKRDDNASPDKAHAEELDVLAIQHIAVMVGEGFHSGELTACISDVDYRGWWDLSRA